MGRAFTKLTFKVLDVFSFKCGYLGGCLGFLSVFALFYLIYFITNCSDSIRSQKEAMCHTDIFLMTMKKLLDYL